MDNAQRNAAWFRRFENDETIDDIAKADGVTRNAVAGAIHRHRLRNPDTSKRPPKRSKPKLPPPKPVTKLKPKPEPIRDKPACGATLLEAATANACLFPVGVDPDSGSHAFCAAPRGQGRPVYCEAHHRATHMKIRPKPIHVQGV